MLKTPKIYFYIPSSELIRTVPDSIVTYWEWLDRTLQSAPAKVANGDALCTWGGPYNWVVQTFIYLRDSGFPCELVDTLQNEGIIISHGDFLPFSFKPTSTQFVVEMKPDRDIQCRLSNLVIIQNKQDPLRRGIDSLLINSEFVVLWPQPGLIPRDSTRLNRFENICYMGTPMRFINEVEELEKQIKSLGLKWEMIPRERYHDYSEVDAIVAVNPIDSAALDNKKVEAWFDPRRKPATKLYNAWLAGVPAILSPEPAFENLRKSKLDYLEAKNVSQIIEQISRLKNDPVLRESMITNGRMRAEEFSPAYLTNMWIKLIETKIIPQYYDWTQSSERRRNRQFLKREIAYKIRKKQWKMALKMFLKYYLKTQKTP